MWPGWGIIGVLDEGILDILHNLSILHDLHNMSNLSNLSIKDGQVVQVGHVIKDIFDGVAKKV